MVYHEVIFSIIYVYMLMARNYGTRLSRKIGQYLVFAESIVGFSPSFSPSLSGH